MKMESLRENNLIGTYIWWCWPVNEEEVWMIDSSLCKLCFVIFWLVKTNNAWNSEMFEYLKVIFWWISSSITSSWVDGTHEGNKLVGNNEIQVPIFNFLIIFVLFVVKLSEIVPSVADTDLKTFQALVNWTTISTITIGSVAERPELLLVRGESFPSDICRLSQDNNHEGTHKIACISLLVEFVRSVVK